ncbi:phosphatase 2C-like domain-containing protein [Phycomyces nitens]|nr:phosphatase 2C-like domain-containing protein [Phycomyces nitens]
MPIPIRAAVTTITGIGLSGVGYIVYRQQQDAFEQKQQQMLKSQQAIPAQPQYRDNRPFTLLSPEAIDQRLRADQSVTRTPLDRVKAVYTSQVASNNPVEDNYSVNLVGSQGLIAGVYDGHIGPDCSRMIKTQLPKYVARQLDSDKPQTPEAVESTISQAFVTLDADIQQRFYDLFPKNLNRAKENDIQDAVRRHPNPAAAEKYIREAITGSCACAVYLDGDDLYAANTGDSRVVVVRKELDGSWTGRRLVEEQSPAHPDWKAYMISQHPPNEADDIVKRKRIFGLIAVGGSFGDIMYKVPVPYQMKVLPFIPYDIYRTFARYHHRIVVHYHTPPYLSSKPLVSHHKLTPQDKYIILGTDGLWDELSWDNVRSSDGDQVAAKLISTKGPDANPATHMIRQALLVDAVYKNVGARQPVTDPTLELSKRLTRTPSRNYRDDITVTVIQLQSDEEPYDPAMGRLEECKPVDTSDGPIYTPKPSSWLTGWIWARL